MAKKRATEEETIEKVKPFEPRKYVCSQWPFLRLVKGIRFDAGFFTAETLEQAEIVEKNAGFGRSIIRIREREKSAPATVEEAAELAALAELKKLEPKARRGMIGTITGV